MSALPPTTDDTPMWDLWQSMIRMPVVTAADEVGIFKAVSDEPLTTEELASKIGVDARMLSINLAQKMMSFVKENRRTPKEAA